MNALAHRAAAGLGLVLIALHTRGQEPDSPAVRLMRGDAVACRPRVSHFCRNIHIGCIGRSRVKTFPFTLTRDGDTARIAFRDTRTETAPAPRAGSIDPARSLEHVIVWLEPPPEHVKLNADGTYSFRIRVDGVDYMSYGRCR